MIRSQSLVTCLWSMNFTEIFNYFLSPQVGQNDYSGLELNISLLPQRLPFIIFQQVRLQLTNFSKEQVFLWIECSEVFKNGSFPLHLLEAPRHFPWYCEHLVKHLEGHFTTWWCGGGGHEWVSPEVFTLRHFPTEPPEAVQQLLFRSSNLSTGSQKVSDHKPLFL